MAPPQSSSSISISPAACVWQARRYVPASFSPVRSVSFRDSRDRVGDRDEAPCSTRNLQVPHCALPPQSCRTETPARSNAFKIDIEGLVSTSGEAPSFDERLDTRMCVTMVSPPATRDLAPSASSDRVPDRRGLSATCPKYLWTDRTEPHPRKP